MTGKPYGNLEDTMEDIRIVEQGLISFKFLKKNIKTLINPDAMQVKFAFQDAYRKIVDDGKGQDGAKG